MKNSSYNAFGSLRRALVTGLACLLALGVAAVWGLERQSRAMERLRASALGHLAAAASLHAAVNDYEIALLRFMEYLDPDLSRAQAALGAAEAALGRLPPGRAAPLEPLLARLRTGADELLRLAEDPDVFEELGARFGAIVEEVHAVEGEIERVLAGLRAEVEGESREALASAANLRLWIAALGAGGWLVLLAAALVGVRAVQDPFEAVLRFLTGAARRDLSAPLELTDRNELGELARAAATLRGNLVGGLRRLRDAAGELDAQGRALRAAAEEAARRAGEALERLREGGEAARAVAGETRALRGAAEDLRRRAEETVSSVQQILAMSEEVRAQMDAMSRGADGAARAVEQLGQAASQVAAFAGQVGASARTVGESASSIESAAQALRRGAAEGRGLTAEVLARAEDGRTAMDEALAAMARIEEAVRHAVDRYGRLEDDLSRVGRVLGVIDEVAGRTNLLSLNASIIAAQAGEKGRAFGVVANEIRALAEQVSAGTREIQGVVGGLVSSGQETREAIARGAERVREGRNRVQLTAAALGAIHEAARRAAERLVAIDEAGAAQAREAEQVAREIVQMTQGVEGIVEAVRAQEREIHGVLATLEEMAEMARQTVRATDEQARGTELLTQGAMDVSRVAEELEEGAGRLDELAAGLAANLEALAGRAREDLDRSETLDRASETLAATAGELSRQVGAYRLPEEGPAPAPG